MLATRVFQNGNSQAIRIPQEFRTDKKDYLINKIGEVYIVYPKDDPWAQSRSIVGTFPKDFMSDRSQPLHPDEREEFLMYLLDTNIFIYYMKNSYPKLTKKIFSLNPEGLFISSITLFELEYGAEKSNWGARTREKLYTLLSPFHFLNYTSQDAIESGRIRGMLEKKGTPIGTYDTFIAGQAISRGLILVTHNIKEFNRIPNLVVEDWIL